jgi:hypothetical protein
VRLSRTSAALGDTLHPDPDRQDIVFLLLLGMANALP